MDSVRRVGFCFIDMALSIVLDFGAVLIVSGAVVALLLAGGSH